MELLIKSDSFDCAQSQCLIRECLVPPKRIYSQFDSRIGRGFSAAGLASRLGLRFDGGVSEDNPRIVRTFGPLPTVPSLLGNLPNWGEISDLPPSGRAPPHPGSPSLGQSHPQGWPEPSREVGGGRGSGACDSVLGGGGRGRGDRVPHSMSTSCPLLLEMVQKHGQRCQVQCGKVSELSHSVPSSASADSPSVGGGGGAWASPLSSTGLSSPGVSETLTNHGIQCWIEGEKDSESSQ